MSRTYYSNDVKGDCGNYGWPVNFDITDGYVGINQVREDGESDRVLLSPKQVAALAKFVAEHKSKRRRTAA
jgi:hypothetical protein